MSISSDDFTIDLRKLRLLLELEKRGTIGATATALHVTPSAVSQQLAALSRELGVPLLERRGRGVQLTGQARLLLEHAGAVREHLERARSALAAWSQGQAGEVRIGSLSTGIAALVGPAIARLRDERPELVVSAYEVDGDEGLTMLDAGDLDMLVTVDFVGAPTRSDRRYHRRELITDVLDAVFPSGHPLADPAGVRLADLAGETWIGAAPDDSCAQITVGVCASAGFTPDVRHHCREWDAVAALVAAGAGVALVPRLAQPLRQAGLVVCPVVGEPASRLLIALVRSGSRDDPATTAVLDLLSELAAQRPDATGVTGVG